MGGRKLQRQSLLLLALILAVLLAFALFFKPSQEALGEQSAKTLALVDAKEYASKNYLGVQTAISAIEAKEIVGSRWAVAVEIVSSPHSPCPQVERLDYEMMPISIVRKARPVKDCETHPITRREQALINSAKFGGIAQMVVGGAAGCAFQVPFFESNEKEYCPFADFSGLKNFAAQNLLSEGSWVVSWQSGSQKIILALDSSGAEIARSG